MIREIIYCLAFIIIVAFIAALLIKVFPNEKYVIGISTGWAICLFTNRKRIFYLNEEEK